MDAADRIQGARELKGLESASAQLKSEIKCELGGAFSEDDDRLAFVQIGAILNVGVVAYWGHSTADQVNLEWLLVTFATLFGLEMAISTIVRGWHQTVRDKKHPELQTSWRLGAVVVLVGIVGAVFLVVDQEHVAVSAQTARTLSAFTVFLLITSNRKFGEMTLAFGRATKSVIPTAVAILMIVFLYAVASKALFGDKVEDPDTGLPYFDTFTRSLATMFRLFTGNLFLILNPVLTPNGSSQATGMIPCFKLRKSRLRLLIYGSLSMSSSSRCFAAKFL